jgi:hypothetical protein
MAASERASDAQPPHSQPAHRGLPAHKRGARSAGNKPPRPRSDRRPPAPPQRAPGAARSTLETRHRLRPQAPAAAGRRPHGGPAGAQRAAQVRAPGAGGVRVGPDLWRGQHLRAGAAGSAGQAAVLHHPAHAPQVRHHAQPALPRRAQRGCPAAAWPCRCLALPPQRREPPRRLPTPTHPAPASACPARSRTWPPRASRRRATGRWRTARCTSSCRSCRRASPGPAPSRATRWTRWRRSRTSSGCCWSASRRSTRGLTSRAPRSTARCPTRAPSWAA